jgi:outer membrane protein OmpA-like peptidoglycan-associated protein
MANDSAQKAQDIAGVLQQVDVSEIFTNLALGIAKAQEALDDNSIKQLIRLSEQEVAGKSLLELGFVPAFYQFDYADVSANISIQMRLSESSSLALQARFDFAKQLGYSKENVDMLDESQSETYRDEFKSSRDFLMKANEEKSIKVKTQTFSMNQEEGAVTKVRNFREKINEVEGVHRAQYTATAESLATSSSTDAIFLNADGYITIYVPPVSATDDRGILKMSDYVTSGFTSVDVNDGSTAPAAFTVQTDFSTVLASAKTAMGSGTVIGFNESGVTTFPTATPVTKPMEVYFWWNEKFVDMGYDGREFKTSAANPTFNNNTTNIELHLDILGKIMKLDSSIRVRITGHADSTTGTGPDNTAFNEKLGMDRADAVKKYLMGMGAKENQFELTTKGEQLDNAENPNDSQITRRVKFRKATVEIISAPDYIYFKGSPFDAGDATPAAPDTKGNGFIWRQAAQPTAPTLTPSFTFLGESINLAAIQTTNDVVSVANKATLDTKKFDYEVVRDRAYLLHETSTLHFTALSTELEEIEMQEASSSSTTQSESESTYFIDETINKKSKMKRDSEKIKNPGSIAFGANIDVRTARSMEVSMQGNSSMSARLRSVPPPDVFIEFIRSSFGGGQ